MPRPIPTYTTTGKARAILGLSAEKLSQRSGVGKSTIQKIENGRHPLTIDTARKLGFALQVDPFWLLHGDITELPRPIFSAGEKYDPELANATYELMAGKGGTPAQKAELNADILRILESAKGQFGAMLQAAHSSGNGLQAALDADIFIRNSYQAYAPKEFKKEYRVELAFEKAHKTRSKMKGKSN